LRVKGEKVVGIQSAETLDEEGIMGRRISKKIRVLEFRCLAAVRFFEHCAACPRFEDDCRDLALGKEVLRGKKKIAYGVEPTEDSIHISAFHCLAPVHYIERSRIKCTHDGRCRDEGLLLALLNREKVLDYSHKEIVELPPKRRRSEAAKKAA
jgi:hypothetical protein